MATIESICVSAPYAAGGSCGASAVQGPSVGRKKARKAAAAPAPQQMGAAVSSALLYPIHHTPEHVNPPSHNGRAQVCTISVLHALTAECTNSRGCCASPQAIMRQFGVRRIADMGPDTFVRYLNCFSVRNGQTGNSGVGDDTAAADTDLKGCRSATGSSYAMLPLSHYFRKTVPIQ